MLKMFYFSGTGNARNVAQWMAAAWQSRGREAETIDIANPGPDAMRIGPDDEIGIASPTHGFNFPPITLRFIFGFPRAANSNRVYILNTRGSVRLFGLRIPGLSGVAQLLAAFAFLLKGYRVSGMRPVDLPSNWIALHPGLCDANIRAIYERGESKIRRFAGRLLDGGRDLRALWDLPQDLLIAPLALGYYFIGRFFFAKSFISSNACDACGACVKQCPVQAIKLVHGRPFWSYRCESCMRCVNLCPKRAIQTAHGFVVAVSVLFAAFMTAVAYPALQSIPVPDWPGAEWAAVAVRFTIESIVLVLVLFLSYRILHPGLRFRIIERLAVLTSLTHFGFWRRYRAPKREEGREKSD